MASYEVNIGTVYTKVKFSVVPTGLCCFLFVYPSMNRRAIVGRPYGTKNTSVPRVALLRSLPAVIVV